MKSFHRLVLAGLVSLALACSFGCNSTKSISQPAVAKPDSQTSAAKPVITATNQAEQPFFPLMPWNHAPNDLAVLKKMKECGLTVAGFVSPGTLDACQSVGLKAIVNDPRTVGYDWTKVDAIIARSNVMSLVAETGKHPAVYGYYLRDEPGADFFAGLANVVSPLNEFARGKLAYMNCFPNYAENWQLGTTNYIDYLELFIKTVHPKFLSYDNYSIMDDGSLKDVYWSNLEQMREVAKRHELPFWNTILAVGTFNFREPSAADFRFQVYSSLAYGARGIAYFTYFAPQVGNYQGAPVDQFGNATPNWHNMQNVNLQVQKLAPTLLQLTSDEVYHFGSVPGGCKKPSKTSLLKGVKAGNLMAGDLTHKDGTRYVFIVNKDFQKSIRCKPQFRQPPKRVQMVSPYTGALIAFEGEQLWLSPGGGVLLRIER